MVDAHERPPHCGTDADAGNSTVVLQGADGQDDGRVARLEEGKGRAEEEAMVVVELVVLVLVLDAPPRRSLRKRRRRCPAAAIRPPDPGPKEPLALRALPHGGGEARELISTHVNLLFGGFVFLIGVEGLLDHPPLDLARASRGCGRRREGRFLFVPFLFAPSAPEELVQGARHVRPRPRAGSVLRSCRQRPCCHHPRRGPPYPPLPVDDRGGAPLPHPRFLEEPPAVPREDVQHDHLAPLIHVGEEMAHLAVRGMEQIEPVGAYLRECRQGPGEHHVGRVVVQQARQQAEEGGGLLPPRGTAGVELEEGVRGALAHVRAAVRRAPLDRQDLDLQHVGDADAGHGPEGQGADEGLRIGQTALEGVDGQQGQLPAGRVVVGVPAQVDVHHLAHLEGGGPDQLDDVGEEVGHIPPLGHGGQEPLHPVEQDGRRGLTGRVGARQVGPDLPRAYGLLEVLRVPHGG